MSGQHSYPHHSTRAGCVKHSMCQQGVPMTLAGVRRPRTNCRKGIPWRRFFRSLATYLNLMVIVGIWISARYPTGSLAVSSSEWAPNFLHDAWGISFSASLVSQILIIQSIVEIDLCGTRTGSCMARVKYLYLSMGFP
ncbi:uncharacterized protein MELLADRAFT_104657 [Melampsora larici-populina 98AG31]|uniref:Uncharacterized protein n=1 Tax=Melampsora larici-populina (strain 98AG31 / pathotype 3-4-7) TaxID=747676 RepID=F4RFG9_MELLP|nr:uncharacterized protein MELLADRAFT_104657 [Melampsora larici-populina 98AG31]EGG08931.1 hypothetical protein MELLADRAFT_104657 [Melampsora larici-populina 98AG31]